MHVRARACVALCVSVCLRAVSVCARARASVCACVCELTCVYLCVYVCVCMNTLNSKYINNYEVQKNTALILEFVGIRVCVCLCV
jgi:hypothetical protein